MESEKIIKIFIEDGIVTDVMADPETKKLITNDNISIEIIDYDRNRDDKEAFEKTFEGNLESMDYCINHPGSDD